MDTATIILIVLCSIGGLLLLTIFFKMFKWISAIGIILIGVGIITYFIMSNKKEGYDYTRNYEDPENPEDEILYGTVWDNPKHTTGLGWTL